MTPLVKLGFKASAEQLGSRESVELGAFAEPHGMGSATVSDHIEPWRYESEHALFSLASEDGRPWAPMPSTPEQKHSSEDPIEMEKAADELPTKQVAERWIVTPNPNEAVEKARVYTDPDLNHLMLNAPGHDKEQFIELNEPDLVPRIRRLRTLA